MKNNIQILQSYSNTFRDLINDKNLGTKDTIKGALRLNKEEDWSFIWTSMDIVDDASLALESFLKFGLDGPARYNDVGEKYLRLYGILNASYIQQQAIITLYKLNNVPDPREAFEKIKALKIREIRHKIASHPCDYVSAGQKDKLESYVPVRLYLSEFNIGFVKGEKIEIETVSLKDYIEEHIELMVIFMDKIIEKSIITFFQGNQKKLAEFNEKLRELRIERDGGIIIKTEDGETSIVIMGHRQNN